MLHREALETAGSGVSGPLLAAAFVTADRVPPAGAEVCSAGAAVAALTEPLTCRPATEEEITAVTAGAARSPGGELARLREEVAELWAAGNPRLRCTLVKAAPGRDLYVGWSPRADGPTGLWTRQEALAHGFPGARLERADRTGTSAAGGDGAWQDAGFVADQRGWLRREHLAAYAAAYLAGDYDRAYALLEPFEDEERQPDPDGP